MEQHAAIDAGVSTVDRSCERQVTDLTASVGRGRSEFLGIFRETASGAIDSRRVLEPTQARSNDVIPVTELSRWGCSTRDLPNTPCRLTGWNASPVAMSGMTFETDTLHGGMLASIAPFERDLPDERLRASLEAVRGRTLGREPGRRSNSDLLTPEVLRAVAHGRRCRWIARKLGNSGNAVADIVKRHRNE